MAKKKTVPKQSTGELDKRIKALETGLRGLGDVSRELDKARTNLRKYLDDAEETLGYYPRVNPPRPRRR
jgi:hypothetical protein